MRIRPLERIWIGTAFGFLLAMILPAAFAFIFRFSVITHIASLLVLFLLNLLAFRFGKTHRFSLQDEEKQKLTLFLTILLPFTVLIAYLQYTHNIRLGEDGAYYVGQSTYGDLPLHLSIITGAKDAVFPMDYSIFPGMRLSYPFLIDTLSTSLWMLGMPLSLSISLPGTLITACIFYGYLLLAYSITRSRSAAVLAFLFLFVNGGLGFIYHLDLKGGTLGEAMQNILEGFYKTPTNQPDPYNLRWSNIIADMLIPQRTFMGGWLILMPALYLLLLPYLEKRLHEKKELLFLILFTGFLPMVNTHAFLAIGIFSIGQFVLQCLYSESEHKKKRFQHFILFGAASIAIALPQLLLWTFGQALGAKGFLRVHFNWVNNDQNGLIDNYIWFYLKNIGILLVPVVLSLFSQNKKHRSIVWSAFLIFVAAELILFQPNPYDNNKIFYVWYALCLPVACEGLLELYRLIKTHAWSKVIAVSFLFICLLSGTLTLLRETVSNYRQFDAYQVAAADFIAANTDKDKRFITGTQHINPVSSLAGRSIVVGPDLWLYYHGIDTTVRKRDIKAFYENIDMDVLHRYNVEYIYLSSYERASYHVNEEAMDTLFPIIYENSETKIYQVIKP